MQTQAAQDYWRQQCYPLAGEVLDTVLAVWNGVDALVADMRGLVAQDLPEGAGEGALADAMRMLNENAPNDQVIKLKALEAFQKAADGKATKIIIPSEIQGLAGLAASAKTLLEDDKPEQNQ